MSNAKKEHLKDLERMRDRAIADNEDHARIDKLVKKLEDELEDGKNKKK